MSIITKLREPKIADFIIFDWVATVLSAAYIGYKYNLSNYETILAFIVLIILSIILHLVFKIDTKTNYLLGISKYPVRSK